MTEKLTPDRRKELTRTALVDSARRAFAQKGFEGASLDDIAADAGFTRGAIYKHFANKEDLFFAVFEQFNERVLDAFTELNSADLSAALDPKAIARTLIGSEVADNELWALGVEYSLFEYRNPGSRKRIAERRRQGRERITRYIEENTAAIGLRLRVPADTMAAILLTVTDGFVYAARVDPTAEDLYATFLELILPTMIEGPDPPAL